ncbi:hypothetical protein ACF0H5_015009 [Mactra antiquata]
MLDPCDSVDTTIRNIFNLKSETSFESGYNTSPTSYCTGLSPKPQVQDCIMEPTMDSNKFLVAGSLLSPFKTGSSVVFGRSPIKNEILSPFKDSSLSPFKLIGQSPSKGSFGIDDWDEDLIASFEENLFGMNDPSELDDWLRSPNGKAFVESRNSPIRLGSHHPVVQRLRISPSNNRKQRLQPIHDNGAELISEPVYVNNISSENFTIKEEPTCHDHLYGQSSYDGSNTLSAIDPNKMGATPVKPRYTNMENAPIRKLSMKMQGSINSVPNLVVQKGSIVQVENIWPSKEKLKFARQRFREILNNAVEREIEIIKDQKEKKKQLKNKENGRKMKMNCATKVVPTGGKSSKSLSGKQIGRHHGGKGGKSKAKTGRQKSKKDKYPQIKMALSKPQPVRFPNVVHKELYPTVKVSENVWYHSDVTDSDEDTWTGPPPMFRQSSSGFQDNSDTSDDEWKPECHAYETLSGRKVKKRRLY